MIRFLLRLSICILLSHSVLAAGLYVQFEDFVPDAWNPAYGYFLKNSHVLSNARLNGCYGSKQTMQELNAGNTTFAVGKETWRHSTFESSRPGEYARDVENRLSYPIEPLAAFIQWLYPSPARTSLGHNANSHDPLGVWARMVNGDDSAQKAQALETMAGFIALVKSLYEQPTLDDTAQKAFSRQFNGLFNPQDVGLKRIDIFKEIVFKAIQAERFDENIKKLYPAGMARYTLLAYITDVLSDREDLVAIYKKAGLITPEYTSPPIAPLTKDVFEEKKQRIQSPPSAGVAGVPVELSDLVLYLQGRDRYDSALPKCITSTTAIIEVDSKRFSYADCGETALMNFFLIALWKDGAINPAHLDHLVDMFPHIGTIREHFASFNTLELLATKESHNNWAAIVANKNSAAMANPLQRIKYNRGGVAELAGATPSLLNLFSVWFSPTATMDDSPHRKTLEAMMTPWETEDLSSSEDQALVLRKWQAISSLLSRSDHVIALKTEKLNNKKIESTVEFTLNGENPFSYAASRSHFHINTRVDGQSSLRPTLKEIHTSKEIIYAAFGDSWGSEFFLRSLVGETNVHWPHFGDALKKPHTELFKGILDAIFYRCFATSGYGRMDDFSSYFYVADAWKHGGLVKDLYTSSASRDFLEFQYLPYVFPGPITGSSAFELCQKVIEQLKAHGEYNSYIDSLMNSSNPKKWEFAAFHGAQKSNGLYIKKLQDFHLIPFDAHHPLMHAIQNGHLKIAQYLTGNGKSPYWKAKKDSMYEERPVLEALRGCSFLPMVGFLIKSNPDLLSAIDDAPRQSFLNCAKTPEIFKRLQRELALEAHELYSFPDINYPEKNISILDTVLNDASDDIIRHVLEICPDITVTGNTFRHLSWRFCSPYYANSSLEIVQTIIDKYAGDWNTCMVDDIPVLQFLMDIQNSGAMLEMILPKLGKDTLIEGKSPYVYCAERPYVFLDHIWLLSRHQFPWPQHIPTTQDNVKLINAIRWIFNQQNPGDVLPTLDEINSWDGYVFQHHPMSPNPMYAILKADFEARKKVFLRSQELENFHWFRMACDRALESGI